MSIAVIDATIVSGAVRFPEANVPAGALYRKFLLEMVNSGVVIRYNSGLQEEYRRRIESINNDMKDLFVRAIADRGVVARNSLRKSENAAAQDSNWPKHDRHLLAAAIDEPKCVVHVSEPRHATCASVVRRKLGIVVELVQ